MIVDHDFEEAKCLYKALIIKGSEIFNSELNINLADCYYGIGEIFLRLIE